MNETVEQQINKMTEKLADPQTSDYEVQKLKEKIRFLQSLEK